MSLLEYKITEIAPDGRNKYGNYYSKGNMTRNVTSVTYEGNATTTSVAQPDTHVTPTQKAQFTVQAEGTSIEFFTDEVALYTTKTIGFSVMKDTDYVPFLICDVANVTPLTDGSGNVTGYTAPANSGVTCDPAAPLSLHGLEVSFPNNGTSAATIGITANPSIMAIASEGTLSVPITIFEGEGTQPEDNSLWVWMTAQEDLKTIWIDIKWTISQSPSEPSSVYRLSLSNDNASIICDSAGTFVTGTTTPSTNGKLYYGSDLQTGATYVVSASTPVTGMTTGVTGGVLSISFDNQTLNFTGGTLAVVISGKVQNTVVDVKTFNVTKAIAGATGAGGKDATIWWIETNYDEVIYDPNTLTISPERIYVSGYSQTGANAPDYHSIDMMNYYIYYQLQPIGSTTWIPSSKLSYDPNSGIRLNSYSGNTYQRIRLFLEDDYNPGRTIDQEDIEILRHGTSGATGGVGRTGAAIRGPYDYYEVSGDSRYWFNGEPYAGVEESEKWIDVIIKDGTYYYCNTTYYGLINWSLNSDKWTSGASFDFIATNLLLADNAKIKFQTGNEIYMEDSAGTITAGVYGGNGSDVAFWAGNSEADPKFSVDHDGNLNATNAAISGTVYATDGVFTGTINAKQGVFAGNVYSPYTFIKDLSYYTTSGGKVIHNAEDHAYLVSDMTNNDHGGSAYDATELRLPPASSALNGYTYDILICPYYGIRASTYFSLRVGTINHTIIYNGAPSFSTEYYYYTFQSQMDTTGNVKITCMPVHSNISDFSVVNYAWVITYVNCPLTGDNN